MRNRVPLAELDARMKAFRSRMDAVSPDWELAAIISKVNLYYFTGTMQDGLLLIYRGGSAVFYVRRSYERALDESLFPSIEHMESYRDIPIPPSFPKTMHMEMDIVPLAVFRRLQKYFPFEKVEPLDYQLASTRAVKSPYELELMKTAGEMHRKVLEDMLPGMLKEGISEAELSAELFSVMISAGHHGVARFSKFDTEMLLGNICFGESSIYPTYFDGPGGNLGLSAAVPLGGSRERKLRKGDLVFVDTCFGYEGYHTDKTITCMFGKSIPDHALRIHEKCVDIQDEIAEMLKPGAVPADIYCRIQNSLDTDFTSNFMGYGKRRVKFLGHSTGLQIDEFPAIADGFREPLAEGMVLALEPKAGVAGVGMVGIENTFLVSQEGGRCITGSSRGMLKIW